MKGICWKRIVICLLSAAIFISSCSTKKNSAEIVIEGKIIPSGDRKVYLYGFANDTGKYKGKKVLLDSSEVSVSGKYFLSHSDNAGYLFDLKTKYSIQVTNLFLQPGDHLTLNFIKGTNQPEIPGNDACSKYNNYLLQFSDSFYRSPDAKGMYYVGSNYLTLADYHTYTAQRRQQQLQFYSNYFNGNSPDSLFANFAISEINYQFGNDNLLFLWKRRMRGIRAMDDSTSYDFLRSLQIENPQALNSPAYFYFLLLYIDDLYNQGIEKEDPSEIKPKASEVVEDKKLLAEKNLAGKFREIAELNISESLRK